MILEGIVTTQALDGTLNVAPMGPEVGPGPDLARFTLRPYITSTTYRNLKGTGEGVFHVTDDVLLLARAAIGPVVDAPCRPAGQVRGRVLDIPGRYHEFRVLDLGDRAERTTIRVETVAEGRQARDLFGLNRAKHAVVEAAILATRLRFLPLDAILADFDRLAPLVAKTAGPDERLAFALLLDHVRDFARRESASPPDPALER